MSNLSQATLQNIVDITLEYRQQIGERFFPLAASRAVAAGLAATFNTDLADAMACELLRCRVVNHEWNGSIA